MRNMRRVSKVATDASALSPRSYADSLALGLYARLGRGSEYSDAASLSTRVSGAEPAAAGLGGYAWTLEEG